MAAMRLTREDLHDGPSKEALPETLQNAERDDTVCKYVVFGTITQPRAVPCGTCGGCELNARLSGRYCGVAYLVFSEIKELEKKLKATQATMAQWKVHTHWRCGLLFRSQGARGSWSCSACDRTKPSASTRCPSSCVQHSSR